MKKWMLLSMAAMVFFAFGCGDGSAAKTQGAIVQVSAKEAQKMMSEETDYILLDVRTAAEYSEGHIPNAVNLPNEAIQKEPPALLSDKAQRIFIYCRSGRRSHDAATKLAAMGYTNIVDFGGINDWNGEVVK